MRTQRKNCPTEPAWLPDPAVCCPGAAGSPQSLDPGWHTLGKSNRGLLAALYPK